MSDDNKPEAEVTYEEFERELNAGTLTARVERPSVETTFNKENVEKFILGEVTWAQLMAITIEEAFAVAEVGYKFYEEGRFHDARTVFEALVMANPYEPYFHNVLGAILQQLDLNDEAFEQFGLAIELDPEQMHAFINRGEMELGRGNLDEAVADFRAAIAIDKTGNEPLLARARVIVQAADTVLNAFQRYLDRKAAEGKP